MNYLSAENLGKTFGDKWLFRNINFGLSKGEKVALVGKNGAGKSTFLNILTQNLPPDEGTISYRKGITVGYLPQNPVFEESKTVLDTLFDGNSPMIQATKLYELALNSGDDVQMTQALEQMELYKAWDFENKVKQILTKLSINFFEKPISELSGGQKKRVALAQLMIQNPEILILDEPTNHLDLETIEWLENQLSTQNITLLLISHDRYFMDAVCDKIVEIEESFYLYKGNYAYFLEKKSERQQMEASSVEKAKNLLRKELEWMRRQPKARSTKAQSRIDAFGDLQEKASKEKKESHLTLNTKMSRQGSKILEINNLEFNFGTTKIVDKFSYTFKKKDRIGIIGKNGVGKSTFLELLMQNISGYKGEISTGETIVYGYYTQKELKVDENLRVIEYVKEVAEVITVGNGEVITASQFLTHFLFEPARQYTPVMNLSGGEKRRLQLMRILLKNPNFLILDEPTNDLDIDSLNVLEEYLSNFGGCLIVVSHDRYFMDTLVEHLFVFKGEGEIQDFNGNYTDFRASQEKIDEKSKAKEGQKTIESPIKKTEKLTFKEQKELENLEKEISKTEQLISELVEKLNAGNSSFEEIQTWSSEIQDLTKKMEIKELRWIELSEKG